MDWLASAEEELFADAPSSGGDERPVALAAGRDPRLKRPDETDIDYWVRRTTEENPLPLSSTIPPQASTRSLSTPSKPIPRAHSDHIIKQVLHAIRFCANSQQREKLDKINTSFDVEKYIRDMPLYTADHEEQLLYEAGSRPSPLNPGLRIDVPPCVFNEECVVRSRANLIPGFEANGGQGFVMMRAMTPAQLKTLYTTGRKPDDPFSCLCCTRYILSMLVENVGCADLQLDKNTVVQLFYNEVDTPNGYRKELMHLPNESRWDGTRRPFAKFIPGALRAEFDKKVGKWRIDQRLMRFFGPTEAGHTPGRPK